MSTLEHRLLWMMLKRTGTSHVGEWTFDRSDLRDPVGGITVKWLPNGEAEVIAEPAPPVPVAHRIFDDQSGRDCTACRERRNAEAEKSVQKVPADPQAHIIKNLYSPPARSYRWPDWL